MNDRIGKIVSSILENRRFLVTTHVRPDGDALGSLLAMTSILQRLGKTADPFCEDPVPRLYSFLPGAGMIRQGVPSASSHDVAILLDCGDLHRVGHQLAGHVKGLPLLINIDHHVSNVPFGDISWVQPSASSTCEMLFDLCAGLPVKLDREIACQLYTGLLTDTGSFRFSNTSRRVLEIAMQLVEAGAEPSRIAEQVFDSALPQTLLLLGRVLSTVSFHAGDRLAAAELSREMFLETSTTPADGEGFINHLRSVEPVKLAMLFREEEGGVVHVSLRSKGNVDVAAFAQRFRGGGHRRAAAFRTPGALREIRPRFTEEAVHYLESSG
jgi:phosphoesterase RecJ-like protein